MNLEDTILDILGKAQKGQGITDRDLCKTVTQMLTAILGLVLLALDPAHQTGRVFLEAAIWITALVTAGSGLWYLKANYPLLVQETIRRGKR